jgi:hypothetical protein
VLSAVHNDRVTLRRLGAPVAAAVMAAVTVTGCSRADDPGNASTPSQSDSVSATEASLSGSEPADPDAYLPVPEGVELTPQGSDLAVKESAVVAWQPRQDLVGVLDITVTRLEQTTLAKSFEGWQLDAAARKSTPYFVHATIQNVGDTDVGGFDVPLYAVDATNTLIQAQSFLAKFEPCPGNGVFPEDFGPHATKDICLVYLVPNDGKLTAVSFRPSQDFDPITWTGPIKNIAKPRKG